MFWYATTAVYLPAAANGPQGADFPEGRPERPGPSESSDEPPDPSAPELLAQVTARLPGAPLLVNGNLIVRKWRGTVVSELGFEMFLHWGSRPALARYTVCDAFGRDLKELTVTRTPNAPAVFRYRAGDPLVASALPDLYEPIGGSDVCWHDLALSFLWWPGATMVRKDEVRGRSCYVVKVPGPPGGRYSSVLVWVDRKVRMVLQAEAYDGSGRLQRRLWVKSLKKVDDRWMIKDMEIQGFPRVHRTKLRVRQVTAKPQL